MFLKGDLHVKPTKDRVLREVAEPGTSWTNKVQLEHAAGDYLVPSGEAYCIEVVFDPGVGPFAAIIVLQISG